MRPNNPGSQRSQSTLQTNSPLTRPPEVQARQQSNRPTQTSWQSAERRRSVWKRRRRYPVVLASLLSSTDWILISFPACSLPIYLCRRPRNWKHHPNALLRRTNYLRTRGQSWEYLRTLDRSLERLVGEALFLKPRESGTTNYSFLLSKLCRHAALRKQ